MSAGILLTSWLVLTSMGVSRSGGDYLEPQRVVRYPSTFNVDVWTDRDSYFSGDAVRIYMKADRDCYVILLDWDTRGQLHVVYPVAGESGYLKAGRKYSLPEHGGQLYIEGPAGYECLYLVATQSRIDYPDWFYKDPWRMWDNLPTGNLNPDYYHDSKVRKKRISPPVQPGWSNGESYDENDPESVRRYKNRNIEKFLDEYYPQYPNAHVAFDSDCFMIKTGYSQYNYPNGGLDIRSDPSGAAVYLDGSFYGYTPLTIDNLAPGYYTMRLERPGYSVYKDKIYVRHGVVFISNIYLKPQWHRR